LNKRQIYKFICYPELIFDKVIGIKSHICTHFENAAATYQLSI
jgi:hypothetical protein